MKGILFKPDMIQAIVEGRRTVTRRVIKPQPEDYRVSHPGGYDCPPASIVKYKGKWIDLGDFENDYPRYQVGETVYIKEACCVECYKRDGIKDACLRYDNGEETRCANPHVWQSPLFMPEWAARYFLEITDVRAERLQEITLKDMWAEGMDEDMYAPTQFELLWNTINKDKWESNPWVWVYTFRIR